MNIHIVSVRPNIGCLDATPWCYYVKRLSTSSIKYFHSIS